jgi:glucose 1-dehydrogenase
MSADDPVPAARPAAIPHLAGQTAVVTGGDSGIGAAVSRALAAAGASVIVNYHSHAEDADGVVHQITAAGGRGIAVKADVAREEDVRALFAKAIEQFGTVDVLVSNAGFQQDAPLVDMTLEQWQTVIGVNLTGSFLCAREAVREFLRRGPRPDVSRATGKIIFTSSVHEVIPWAGHVNYAASKGGMMMLMKSIAQEVGPRRIRVNSIAPGAIRTPINTAAWSTPRGRGEAARAHPVRARGRTRRRRSRRRVARLGRGRLHSRRIHVRRRRDDAVPWLCKRRLMHAVDTDYPARRRGPRARLRV